MGIQHEETAEGNYREITWDRGFVKSLIAFQEVRLCLFYPCPVQKQPGFMFCYANNKKMSSVPFWPRDGQSSDLH